MTTPVTDSAPPGTGAPRHAAWALVLICIAQLMVVLDASIANIALPYIKNDLGMSEANLTWIVTGYSLAFGGLLLLGGRLGDLYGRRLIFSIGLTIFALASLLGGFAQNEAMLLGSRGLQGLGAALASPAALALITNTFAPGPARNRAFGVYAMMSGVGAAVGLVLGGWLTGLDSVFGISVDGWRLTFLINVPIGLIAAFFAFSVLTESERHSGWLDVPGAITGTLGLLGIVFGLSRAGEAAYGWGATQTIVSLVLGVVFLLGFVFLETRQKHPLMPLRIFANQTRAVSFVAFMIAPAAMFAMFYFLSLFIQQIVGYSSLKTGFAFLPFSFGMVFGATLSSKLIAKFDPRYVAGIGTLIAAGSLFMFSTISIDDSPTAVLQAMAGHMPVGSDLNYWTSIFPWVVTMSFGMGLTFVTLTLTAVHGVKTEDSGIGSGVLNTMQQVGGALGLALLSTVSLHYINARTATVAPDLAAGLAKSGGDQSQLGNAIFASTFTEGATHAFFVGSLMMLGASALIWIFLNVKHAELADDSEHQAVHVG